MERHAGAQGAWRKAVLTFSLIVVIAVEALIAAPRLPPARDFDQTFYPAIRHALTGVNPYLAEYEYLDGNINIDAPPNFFSPPWLLLILLPFGLFSLEVARALWMIFLVGVTTTAVSLLHPPRGSKGIWPLALVALPWSLVGILYGQVAALVLLGAVLCIVEMENQDGAPRSILNLIIGLLLVGLKPQLGIFIAFPLFVFFLWRRDKRLRPLLAIGVPILGITVFATPILRQSAGVYQIAPLWQSTLERELTLWAQPLWMAHVVRALVMGMMAFWAWRTGALDRDWWAAWLVAVLIIAPYTRAYDGVLLLPVFGQMAARRLWWQSAAFLLIIGIYTQFPNGQLGSVAAPLAAWLLFLPWRNIFVSNGRKP